MFNQKKIFYYFKSQIQQNDIIVYVKGNKQNPVCIFSKSIIEVLNNLDLQYLDIDILLNPEFLKGIKRFTNWSTIPQLYFRGQFIGGLDVIKKYLILKKLKKY